MTLFLILLNPDLFLLRWVLKVEVIHDASPWRVDISSIYQETETKPARIDATAPCFEDKATVNRSVQRHREPKHLLNNGTDRGNCIKNVKDHQRKRIMAILNIQSTIIGYPNFCSTLTVFFLFLII